MVEREGDDRRIEPGVERVEHGAASSARRNGDSSMAGVLASIAETLSPRLMPRFGERRRQPPRARVELGVGAAQLAHG